ncbi:holo-ACP synthase [Dermabacter sp. HSID17554]|nr:holo-ACP synthase [Dermabacter sp. HSID17554]
MGTMSNPSNAREHSFVPLGGEAVSGIGVDIVDIERLGDRLERQPRLCERLFAPEERELKLASLAARVAAKEALGKALGNPGDLSWHDAIVRRTETGRPYLVLRGAALETAIAQDVRFAHLSLSHDGNLATAMVVLETVGNRGRAHGDEEPQS